MFSITSPEFKDGQGIPPIFSCEGDGVMPDLHIHDVPDDALSLVLIVDDPDAPNGTFTHILAFDIPTGTTSLSGDSILDLATFGTNSAGQTNYVAPCPPTGKHRYYFRLYALDDVLGLKQGTTRSDLEIYMEGKILGQTDLMGTYEKRGKDDGNSESVGQAPHGLDGED